MSCNSTLDNFKILKVLGKGASSKVKLGEDIQSGSKFALKILKEESLSCKNSLRRECELLRSIDHTNILKFYNYVENGCYQTKKGLVKQMTYGVIELATGGELFEVLFNSGPFSENLSRFYARQMSSALLYLHNRSIAHRDLKPENLLFDKKLNLKLADFGFSTQTFEKNNTFAGTPQVYMSPEILYKKPYDARKTDIFSAGVVLFILRTKKIPFEYATPFSSNYSLLVKNPQKFWRKFERFDLSEDFKNLIEGMLRLSPEKRLSIKDVINSDWMTKNCDENQARKQMKQNLKKI